MKKSISDICDEIIKSKYIKRTGSPGNYRYEYADLGARHSTNVEKLKTKIGPRVKKDSSSEIREKKYGTFEEKEFAKKMGFKTEGGTNHGARFERRYDGERNHVIHKTEKEGWAFTVESSIGRTRLAVHPTLKEALESWHVNYGDKNDRRS